MTTKYIRQFGAPLALTLALALGACRNDDAGSDTALATDTALNRDLELAGRDSTAQPQLQDVPSKSGTTSRPSTSRPSTSGSTSRASTSTSRPSTSTTASGNTVTSGTSRESATGVIPAGATINLRSGSRVCTNTNKVGDRFTATVTDAVTGSNGAVIPAGATAVVEVVGLKKSENVNDPITMTFRVASININGKNYPVTSEVTYAQVERERASTKTNDAKKVIGGAVVGAAIGQILGKDTKSTVIGAATGAAAGTAVAMGTADYNGCIPSGGRIAIKLNESARVTAD